VKQDYAIRAYECGNRSDHPRAIVLELECEAPERRIELTLEGDGGGVALDERDVRQRTLGGACPRQL
jgi:hypothetical protein